MSFNTGHKKLIGKDANKNKNPFWVVTKNNEKYILLYCEINTLCILCEESYEKILNYEENNNIKITWFKQTNGYICGSNKLFIHQVIMNCYGNGKGIKNKSVDHIDRNPLNNCLNNLRIACFTEQHKNAKGIIEGTKRERKTNAKPLPDNITQQMLKKYVVYYEDYADKEKKYLRQYFKIEKHPKLEKKWIGCKSNKITILEKLQEANSKIDELTGL